MPGQLTPSDRRKLVAILGMLGSDQLGERAAAGVLATALLREQDLTWGDVVVPALPGPVGAKPGPRFHPPPPPPPPRPGPVQPTWREDVAFALDFGRVLTDWERQFLASLARRHFGPTDKQQAILDRILQKIGDF